MLAHDHMVRAEDLRRDLAGGVTAKVVQATVSGRAFADDRAEFERSLYSTEGYMRDAMEAYDEIFATIETMPDEVFVVRRAADIGEAKRTGRLGLILGAEGAKLLEGSVAALRVFYRLGMRHLQLHWATRNQVGTAQSDTDEPGLTEFGREVVTEVNALGMLLDVSHSSAATIADVLVITDRPVINSHTGARELNPRSTQLLWDDQIRDLADNGGVAAVHFCTQVLLSEGRQATIDDVLTHIDYLVDMGGIESVGLGPDYLLDGTQRTRNVRLQSADCRGRLHLDQGLRGHQHAAKCDGRLARAWLYRGRGPQDPRRQHAPSDRGVAALIWSPTSPTMDET